MNLHTRILGATLCVGCASLASAQDLLPAKSVSVRDRPRPEYDALGLPLGSFRLYPRMTVGTAHDDNVFASDTDVIDDRVTTFDADFRLRSQSGRLPTTLYGGADSRSYADNPLEDYVDREGGGSIGYNFARRTAVAVSGDYRFNHESRGEPSVPITSVERPSVETRNALLEITHDFASGQLRFRAANESSDYDDAPLADGTIFDQDFRDRDTRTLEVQGNIVIGESLATFVRVVALERDYDLDANTADLDRDATSAALLGGVALDITNLMTGEVAIGVLELNNRDPGQSDRSSVAVNSNIELYVTQLMTATLDVQRTSAAADIVGSASYIGTDISLGLDYELRRNLILSAAYGRSRREYTDIDRADTNERAGISARWLLNRRMNVGLDYAHIERRWLVEGGRNYVERVLSADVTFAL